jgi:hypothetical protein
MAQKVTFVDLAVEWGAISTVRPSLDLYELNIVRWRPLLEFEALKAFVQKFWML